MASEMTPDQAVNNIHQFFKTAFPKLKSLDLHSGQFTLDDVKSVSKCSPAILLSCLSIGEIKGAPKGQSVRMQMAAFLIVGNGRDESNMRIDKDLAVLKLVGAVLAALDDENWPLSELPEEIFADNLYAAKGMGVALWSVRWEQEVLIGAAEAVLEELDDFLTAGVKWDCSPVDGVPEAEDVFTVQEKPTETSQE